MTDEVIDQPQAESMIDRISNQFGFPAADAPEAAVEAEDSTDALFELDFEGARYKVPTQLKDAFMKNEDYTRKTQDLAESRRSLDQVRTIAEQRQLESAFHESVQGEHKELSIIEAYLQQATKIDWGSMSTDQILRNKIELDGIKERRAELQQSIGQKQNQFQSEVKARIAELRGKSKEIASKSIKDFSEETEKAMRSFAIAEGLADAEYDNVILDPRSLKIIWKAMQFDKVQAGTLKANEKVDKVLKPGPASNKMPQEVVNKLNFGKAMKGARTSSEKASVIESRLSGMFAKR